LLMKSQRIVVIFGAWAFLALAVLAVFGSLSYEYFFVLCLIGFLVIVELSGPFASRPRWRSRVNAVILPDVVVFALIASMKARLPLSDREIEGLKKILSGAEWWQK
jgi:hypothetical protein